MNEATLESMRESIGLRLDGDGCFWHENMAVTHPRLIQVLRAGLGRSADGRPTVRLGNQWGYLQLDGVLYRVRTLRCDRVGEALGGVTAALDDGSEESITAGELTVAISDDGTLHVAVRAGTEWARCLPGPHAALGAFLESSEEGGWLIVSSAGRRRVARLPDGPCRPIDRG